MPTPRLRQMTAADIDPVSAAIRRDGWGDRREWFRFAVPHPRCTVFAAEVDGEVVGTGVATHNGPVAWIGTIWVASSWRGRGLGTALTEAPIEAATAAGAQTLVLVATELGRPLYERLGFEVQTWYVTVEAPGRQGGAGSHATEGATAASRIRPFAASDLPAMFALDRAATGEDRAHLLEAIATPDGTRVVTDTATGDVRGFLVRAPWGGGATIAPDADDALRLLEGRRDTYPFDRKVRAGTLADNEAGLARLAAAGWTEAWRAPRLIRGAPLEWDPTAIWGQFNHALG
jgi:predicted N-acetyltransferase YhbS